MVTVVILCGGWLLRTVLYQIMGLTGITLQIYNYTLIKHMSQYNIYGNACFSNKSTTLGLIISCQNNR
jgi:hypothetical protein